MALLRHVVCILEKHCGVYIFMHFCSLLRTILCSYCSGVYIFFIITILILVLFYVLICILVVSLIENNFKIED